MTAIQIALNRAMRLDGALGAAVVDYVSRMPLGTQGHGNGLDLHQAACAGTDVVRAHLSALSLIGYKPARLEDVLITLDTEYHLVRPLTRRTHQGLFLFLVLERNGADLDNARKELRRIEELL